MASHIHSVAVAHTIFAVASSVATAVAEILLVAAVARSMAAALEAIASSLVVVASSLAVVATAMADTHRTAADMSLMALCRHHLEASVAAVVATVDRHGLSADNWWHLKDSSIVVAPAVAAAVAAAVASAPVESAAGKSPHQSTDLMGSNSNMLETDKLAPLDHSTWTGLQKSEPIQLAAVPHFVAHSPAY